LDIVDPMSTAVQRSLRRTGLAGYEPATMATLLATFQRQRAGFTFFDVGANMALYSAMCGVMFDPGRVVAFEPTPDVADVARRVLVANGIADDVGRVEQCALGETTGTALLHLSAISDSSNSLVSGFMKDVGSIDVDVRTLDGYVEATRERPDVVKIDTETFEPAVIRGARCTLQRHRPWLIVEVLHRKGHDHGADLSEAMKGLGYVYYRLTREPNWTPRSVISGVPGTKETDWLLSPEPIDSRFAADVRRWLDRVAMCTADRNPRLPLLWIATHVLRQRGMRGFAAAAGSYVRGSVAGVANGR
jgi:FkbM family methyltransferase